MAEGGEEAELEPSQDGCEGAFGNAQVVSDIEDVVLDLAFGELVRGEHVVGGQLAHGPQVEPSGLVGEPGEFHVPAHASSEF